MKSRILIAIAVALSNIELAQAAAYEFWGVRNEVDCAAQFITSEKTTIGVNGSNVGVTYENTNNYAQGKEVKCSGFAAKLCSGTNCVRQF